MVCPILGARRRDLALFHVENLSAAMSRLGQIRETNRRMHRLQGRRGPRSVFAIIIRTWLSCPFSRPPATTLVCARGESLNAMIQLHMHRPCCRQPHRHVCLLDRLRRGLGGRFCEAQPCRRNIPSSIIHFWMKP